MNNKNEDFEWFVEHYDELYEKYGVSYIAIRDKIILGVYKTIQDGLNDLLKNFQMGEFILQFCNGDESGYTAIIN